MPDTRSDDHSARPLPRTPEGTGSRSRWKRRPCGHLIAAGAPLPELCETCSDVREAMELCAMAYLSDVLAT